MLKICLVFWESEPQYAYKRYAYEKKTMGEGFMGGGGVHPPLRSFLISDFVL